MQDDRGHGTLDVDVECRSANADCGVRRLDLVFVRNPPRSTHEAEGAPDQFNDLRTPFITQRKTVDLYLRHGTHGQGRFILESEDGAAICGRSNDIISKKEIALNDHA